MGETSTFKAKPPTGTDPIGASSEGASVYELIREDIVEGRLAANERLVVADLAQRHGTSTNPVREALQLLRGEGFVIFAANRGARVRPIDQDFVRDVYEVGVLIEPALTRWFVNMATSEDIAELERIQRLIEENNFADTLRHSELDTAFHTVMYERHYNRHAVELWWKHREVLRAVSRRFSFTIARRAAIMKEHRELITPDASNGIDTVNAGAGSASCLHARAGAEWQAELEAARGGLGVAVRVPRAEDEHPVGLRDERRGAGPVVLERAPARAHHPGEL